MLPLIHQNETTMYQTIIKQIEKKIELLDRIYESKIREYNKTITDSRPWGNGSILEKADIVSRKRMKLRQAIELIESSSKMNYN